MKFTYTAITPEGEKMSGELDAADKFDLADKLKGQDKLLMHAEKAEGGKWVNILKKANAVFARVKTQDKVLFAKNVSAMVTAGLSLSRAMRVIGKQTSNEKLKDIAGKLEEDIRGGASLSDSLKKFPDVFSPLFVSMVHAGEESGNLGNSLSVVGGQLEKHRQLVKKIRGALIYPAIIITAMIVVGIVMLVYVVPTLTATFEDLDVDLPPTTQAIISTSDFLTNNAIISLVLLVFFVAVAVYAVRTKRGTEIFHRALIRLPIIGPIVKKTNAARTSRTLSSLLSSGVDVIDALHITGEVLQNVHYKRVLVDAETRVQKGVALSKVLGEYADLYPPLVEEMVAVGEETGKLSDMLGQLAEFYEGEVEESTKNLSTIIEPILMIIVGVIVGFFAVSMITPMYSLLNTI